MTPADDAVEPFTLNVPQAELDDLRRRLHYTRWPERETVDDWSQGAPLERVQALCAYRRDSYDWQRCEAQLNAWGQHRTTLDGVRVHFLHVRSPVPNALPMIMTHGWPGSVIEFHRAIGPLTDPVAHGGSARDAFHLVIPSMPGYGFSDRPSSPGWSVERIGRAWTTLMGRLGYHRWVAQGGDWGAFVTAAIGAHEPRGCAGVHLNMLGLSPQAGDEKDTSPDVRRAFALMQRFGKEEFGYAKEQATRPQTVGYGLTDSPAGQAAWIYEKLAAWSDPARDPEETFGLDAMLDTIMLYWLPGAAASSARLYWESLSEAVLTRPIRLPVGITIFPHDTSLAPRRWADRLLSNIVHWNEVEAGGHFGAFEQPDIFVREVRTVFSHMR